MELITRKKLADIIGISRQSVGKAIKAKKLRLVGEGRSAQIDKHDHLTVKYINDHSSNRQVAQQSKDSSRDDKSNSLKKTDNSPREDQFGESAVLRDEKLKLQTRKLKIEMAERLGQLVPREDVDKTFNKLSSALLSYIHPLSDRLSTTLAGIFESKDQDKINEVKIMIDKEVARSLDAMKKEITESLIEI